MSICRSRRNVAARAEIHLSAAFDSMACTLHRVHPASNYSRRAFNPVGVLRFIKDVVIVMKC